MVAALANRVLDPISDAHRPVAGDEVAAVSVHQLFAAALGVAYGLPDVVEKNQLLLEVRLDFGGNYQFDVGCRFVHVLSPDVAQQATLQSPTVFLPRREAGIGARSGIAVRV